MGQGFELRSVQVPPGGSTEGRGTQPAGRQLRQGCLPRGCEQVKGGGWGGGVSGRSSVPRQEAVRSPSRPHPPPEAAPADGHWETLGLVCPAALPEPSCGDAGLEGPFQLHPGPGCSWQAPCHPGPAEFTRPLAGVGVTDSSHSAFLPGPGVQARQPPSGRGQPWQSGEMGRERAEGRGWRGPTAPDAPTGKWGSLFFLLAEDPGGPR